MLRSSRSYEPWSSMRLVAIALGLALAGLLAATLGVFVFGSGQVVVVGLATMLVSFVLLIISLISEK